jgi:hypothetical protein
MHWSQPIVAQTLMSCLDSKFMLSVCLLAAGGCGSPSSIAESSGKDEKTVRAGLAVPDSGVNGIEQRISGEPVGATLRLGRARVKAGGDVEVSVKLEIAPLWEIRTLDAEAGFAATELRLDLPDAFVAIGDWMAPPPVRSLMPDGHAAYADEAVFTRRLKIAEGTPRGKVPIRCRVQYEACNERQCLQPTALELQVQLDVE